MEEIYYDFYKAPFCIIKVSANKKGVFSIKFVLKIGKSKKNEITELTLKELDSYFKKNIKTLKFPVFLNLSPFQKSVLNYIKKIPYGEVKTYKEVAEKIGKKNGARAVGQALKRNPLPLFFPCHRIISSKGNLGGFSGGLILKKNLLKLEGFKLNELNEKFV